jgi:enediyne biosynthesis protein E4
MRQKLNDDWEETEWRGRSVTFLLVVLWGMALAVSAVWAQNGDVPVFENVSQAAGVVMIRQSNEKITGQAWGDYDQDGWPDLYLTHTHGPNVLYRNNGDGTFSISPFSDSVALPEALSGGASFADYNNDGWPDLFVANWGANTLFRNDEGQGFTDVTETAGVGDANNGKTASWGDYNGDGNLDLYVANWACLPRCGRPSQGDVDRLYRNNGDGTFTDVTRLLPGSGVTGAGFVASFIDYDNDGDVDIYLVNDEFINPVGNALWRNDGPGCDGWCFTNVSADSGANTRVMGMGLATADYDGDGDLDFFFSNGGPMILLQNQGDGTFKDVAVAAGVDFPAIGWGSVFFDYDNDGWQDLYLAVMEPINQADAGNPLFRNEGDGTFTNLGAGSGAGDIGRTIGVAYADYDRDGWVDLVIGNYDSGYELYRNRGAQLFDNNWLALRVVGQGPVNRDGVGARVTVTDGHGRTHIQDVINGASLGAGNALELHFGLGQMTADGQPLVRDVEIRWPDGTIQSFGPLTPNQYHTLVYGVPPREAELAPGAITGRSPLVEGLRILLLIGIIMEVLILLYSLYLYRTAAVTG